MTGNSTTPWPSAPASPASPPARHGRRAERAAVDLARPRDAAAVLAEVYALILSWPTPEEHTAARSELEGEGSGGDE